MSFLEHVLGLTSSISASLRRDSIRHLYEVVEERAHLRSVPLDRTPLKAGETALGAALDDLRGAPPLVRGPCPIALLERERGEVVEIGGDIGMLRTQRFLADGERARVGRLGLGVAAVGLHGTGITAYKFCGEQMGHM